MVPPLLAAIACAGCVSSKVSESALRKESSYVQSVDCGDAPEMQPWVGRARQVGNEYYPKVCALLAGPGSKFPGKFTISFRKHLGNGRSGETALQEIRVNGEWAEEFKSNPIVFDQLLVHEMAHVAQSYQHRLLGGLLYWSPNVPSYWQEGMAEYAWFKLGLTNGASCPECDLLYPDYRNGYSCACAFLLFLESTHDTNLVCQLNRAIQRNAYSDKFFFKATGERLPELWARFRKTPAFKPAAARALEFRRELGYKDGRAPKDIEARFKAYLDQHADKAEKGFIDAAKVSGPDGKDIQIQIALYLYVTQPGGTAEAFVTQLAKNHRLPGFAKGEHGSLSAFISSANLNSETYPNSRTLTASKQEDSSVYHYTVGRLSADGEWKISKAWRSTPDGKLIEEIPTGEAKSDHK